MQVKFKIIKYNAWHTDRTIQLLVTYDTCTWRKVRTCFYNQTSFLFKCWISCHISGYAHIIHHYIEGYTSQLLYNFMQNNSFWNINQSSRVGQKMLYQASKSMVSTLWWKCPHDFQSLWAKTPVTPMLPPLM